MKTETNNLSLLLTVVYVLCGLSVTMGLLTMAFAK